MTNRKLSEFIGANPGDELAYANHDADLQVVGLKGGGGNGHASLNALLAARRPILIMAPVKAEVSSGLVLLTRQILYAVDTKELFIGDGATAFAALQPAVGNIDAEAVESIVAGMFPGAAAAIYGRDAEGDPKAYLLTEFVLAGGALADLIATIEDEGELAEADGPVILGLRRSDPEDPESAWIVDPIERAEAAEAVSAHVALGTDGVFITAKSLHDMRKSNVLTPADGLLSVPWPSLDEGFEALADHFTAEISADVGLVSPALPNAALAPLTMLTSVSIRNTSGTDRAVYLRHGLSVDNAQLVVHDTSMPQVWAAGSAALRNVPAGKSRTFDRELRRGKVVWTPRPLAGFIKPMRLSSNTRGNLKTLNLPALTDHSRYVVVILTGISSTTVTAACDGSALTGGETIEQIENIENPSSTTISIRVEGLVTNGGTITFDASSETAGARTVAVFHVEHPPATVAQFWHTRTLRTVGNGSTDHDWAEATVPDGEVVLPLTYLYTKASTALLLRSEITSGGGFCAARSASSPRAAIGIPRGPVSSWARSTIGGAGASASLSLTFPIKIG